jgi:hypothetical protein
VSGAPFRWRIPLEIRLASPFVTRGVLPGVLFDTPLARSRGRYVLPGTLVRGVVRAALATLGERMGNTALAGGGSTARVVDAWPRLFGRASGVGGAERTAASLEGWRVDNEPDRGLLDIGDLAVDEPTQAAADSAGEYARIALDEVTGAVRESFLQVIELPFPIGTEVAFRGRVHLRSGPIGPERVRFLLERALTLVPAIGASKSVGFGRVTGFALGTPEPVAPLPLDPPGRRVALTFGLDRPFLVDAERIGGNLYRGAYVIPGAVLKGALATALGDADLLTERTSAALSRVTFGHAFPMPAGGDRPWRPPPLSLAVAGDRVLDRTLAEHEPEVRIAFAPDWKGSDAERVAAFLGQSRPLPEREVRTRTAIDPKTGAARNEALFSWAAVVPDGFRWRTVLDCPKDVALEDWTIILGVLAAGPGGIGKTAAVMEEVRLEAEPMPGAETVAEGEPRYALVLDTPAVLNDIDALRAGTSATADYGAYFEKLGWKLVRHFARQRLVGGHLALRYPPRRDRYEMYLVSEPGAVFVIEPASARPSVPLAELLRSGLPPRLADELRDWRRCPFQRENGFGAVRCHRVDPEAGTSGGIRVEIPSR